MLWQLLSSPIHTRPVLDTPLFFSIRTFISSWANISLPIHHPRWHWWLSMRANRGTIQTLDTSFPTRSIRWMLSSPVFAPFQWFVHSIWRWLVFNFQLWTYLMMILQVRIDMYHTVALNQCFSMQLIPITLTLRYNSTSTDASTFAWGCLSEQCVIW